MILFQDSFDLQPDWNSQTDSISLLTGAQVGAWTAAPIDPQTPDNYIAIASPGFGDNGKGATFYLPAGTGSNAYPMLGGEGSMEREVICYGSRMRISNLSWGTEGAYLRLTRFFNGELGARISPWLLYTANGLEIVLEYQDAHTVLHTGIFLEDTDWHTYVWIFDRGNGSQPSGLIRLYVDGTQAYELTGVVWDGTGETFYSYSFPELLGRLSSDFSGSAFTVQIDDVIWATTLSEVNSFLGYSTPSGTSGETIPTPTTTPTTVNHPTNGTITIYRREVAYDHNEALTEISSHFVWIEERIDVSRTARDLDVPDSLVEKAKGLIILWSLVDLSNCLFLYSDKVYEIMTFITLRDIRGDFHHMEILYA